MNTLRWLVPLGTACAVSVALSGGAAGQVTRTVQLDGADVQGQPCTLDELGAVVAQVDNEFKVLFVMEKEARPKPYQEVDLRADDRLLMVNGRKLASIDQLCSWLDSVAVGSPIQLGIRRDKDMQILSYPKADPKTLPKMHRKIVTQEDGPEGPQTATRTFTTGGKEGEHVAMLRGAGIVVRKVENRLEVMHRMPHASSIEALKGLKEGDRIVSFQGEKVESLDGLEETWNRLPTGETVTFVCSRDGVEHTYSFPKPDASKEPGGAVLITK